MKWISVEVSKDSYSIKGRLFSSVDTCWKWFHFIENTPWEYSHSSIFHSFFLFPFPITAVTNLYSQRILSVEDCLKWKDNVNVRLGEGRVVRWAVNRNLIRSNPVNTDTEGPLKSVRIKRVELRENVRAFFPQGQGHRGGSRIFFRRGCTRLLLYFNTNKPHSFFFFAEYQLY